MKIALGAAKGLAFLHEAEKPVIYRDFKGSNILLDSVSNIFYSCFKWDNYIKYGSVKINLKILLYIYWSKSYNFFQDYNAKLSDFGLAKDGPEGDDTHVSTRVMGTHGYAAPEYIMTGKITILYCKNYKRTRI